MASAKSIKKEWQYRKKKIEIPGPEEPLHRKKALRVMYRIPDHEAEIIGRTIRGWGYLRPWSFYTSRGRTSAEIEEDKKLIMINDYLNKANWTVIGKRAIREFLDRHPKLIEIYKRDTKV